MNAELAPLGLDGARRAFLVPCLAGRGMYAVRFSRATHTLELFDADQWLTEPQAQRFSLSDEHLLHLATTDGQHERVILGEAREARVVLIANHKDLVWDQRERILKVLWYPDGDTCIDLTLNRAYLKAMV